MYILEFYKDNGEWFLNYPGYIENGGKRADLQMVLGADSLLDALSEGGEKVALDITDSVEEMKGEKPALARKMWDYLIRADYIKTYEGKYYSTNGLWKSRLNGNLPYIWLCPVTTLIFGSYPKYIYYKIHKDDQEIQA